MILKSDIKKASRKDKRAMKKIYDEYSQFVWNVALKTCGNRSLASDAAQEVFIKIFKKIGKFRFKSSFKTWVYRISVNTTLNIIKKEKRREGLEIKGNFVYTESSSKNLEAKEEVYEMLSLLKEEERMLIVLREIEGLSYKEISTAAGITLAAVKTKIYRSREKLKKIYCKKK
ncbi:MAG: RNA polymerase sigma factor [Elusimicrobiota bacterium]